jgi:hypothetical protein
VLFCCGDILGKGVEPAFQRSAMLGEDIEQRRQCRITEFSAYRFRVAESFTNSIVRRLHRKTPPLWEY